LCGGKKLQNEELHDISFSPAVIREIKWDGRGMWHVWGRREVHTGIWWENCREGDFFGELSKGDRITLRWINK